MQAAEHDADGKNTAEIQQQMFKCNQALSSQRAGESEEETMARAMRDPEVAVSLPFPFPISILVPFSSSSSRTYFALFSTSPAAVLVPKITHAFFFCSKS